VLVGRRLFDSLGFTLPAGTERLIGRILASALDAGLRRRGSIAARGLRRRTDRPARPCLVADWDAGHRPQGTAPSWRAAADLQRRGQPDSPRSRPTRAPAVQAPSFSTSSSGTATPAAPAAKTASRGTVLANLRFTRRRRTGIGSPSSASPAISSLGPTTHSDRHRRPALGDRTTPTPAAPDRWPAGPHLPPLRAAPARTTPLVQLRHRRTRPPRRPLLNTGLTCHDDHEDQPQGRRQRTDFRNLSHRHVNIRNRTGSRPRTLDQRERPKDPG
jgi:hypothetical protein